MVFLSRSSETCFRFKIINITLISLRCFCVWGSESCLAEHVWWGVFLALICYLAEKSGWSLTTCNPKNGLKAFSFCSMRLIHPVVLIWSCLFCRFASRLFSTCRSLRTLESRWESAAQQHHLATLHLHTPSASNRSCSASLWHHDRRSSNPHLLKAQEVRSSAGRTLSLTHFVLFFSVSDSRKLASPWQPAMIWW